jgi:hypothetical protein
LEVISFFAPFTLDKLILSSKKEVKKAEVEKEMPKEAMIEI